MRVNFHNFDTLAIVAIEFRFLSRFQTLYLPHFAKLCNLVDITYFKSA